MTKKVTLYSAFLVLALSLSYLESFISFDFLAPGIKLGFANLAVIVLIYKKDYLGAILVNIARITLSCLLFSGFNTFIYSLFGAVLSLIFMILFKKIKVFSVVSVSVIGAIMHNVGQLAAALIFMPISILYYSPILILSGIITGAIMGIISKILIKRLKEVI